MTPPEETLRRLERKVDVLTWLVGIVALVLIADQFSPQFLAGTLLGAVALLVALSVSKGLRTHLPDFAHWLGRVFRRLFAGSTPAE
ncbi:hypothetical protein Mal4_46370 [Maioricimonas rarisocia]|uniref:Uncharacterized protein n=1 Tax=Maioricimonas rarisocia TaxID=2528026 RepID=A0A517ZCV0_9PLAN|nr:hypothetical protein [Maioricimonas rarisocia]QDU40281.1 hypothetical protein Mal4_46370 [Maioricimonas rarisocia]